MNRSGVRMIAHSYASLSTGDRDKKFHHYTGPRSRRNRAAAKRNAAATNNPIQSPGEPRYLNGVICVMGLVGNTSGPVIVVECAAPMNRVATIITKLLLWNRSLSNPAIATRGRIAHKNTARRAQAETSSNQQ